MNNPDFEKMAREIMHANMGGSISEISLTSMRIYYTKALQAAFDAGLERAAEIVGGFNGETSYANERRAKAIRAEKSQ